MSEQVLPGVRLGDEVTDAMLRDVPVVALESAVFTHGLPPPHNVEVAAAMDAAVRSHGAIPAICLVVDGLLWIGATLQQAAAVASHPAREKASVRDLGAVIAARVPAGLTVAATLYAADLAQIEVFATGGIGGVHVPSSTGDVSADLLQLSRTPVITVCSGAKSVLDIPRTLEFLEMVSVPVYGYGTNQFPGFYLTDSGVSVPSLRSSREVAAVARAHWELGLSSGIVIGNPIPSHDAISVDEWQVWIDEAQHDARREAITGKRVTPYLLDRVSTLSGGRTVQSNISLLVANASTAADIAGALLS